MADLGSLLEQIKTLTVLELSDFVKLLQEEFGVSAAAPVAAAAAPADAAPVAEAPTSFNVILTGAGEKKINVIKVIREITALGLKEAKDLVEGAPKTVKEALPKAEAEKLKKELEDQGATVELK